MSKPPKIVIPGLNRGIGVPPGYVLGRMPGTGKGPAQLLNLGSLRKLGVAGASGVAQSTSTAISTAHSENVSLKTSVSTSLSQISGSLSGAISSTTSLSTGVSTVVSGSISAVNSRVDSLSTAVGAGGGVDDDSALSTSLSSAVSVNTTQSTSLSQVSSSLSGAISSTTSLSSAVSTVDSNQSTSLSQISSSLSAEISTDLSRINSLSTAVGGGGGGGGTVSIVQSATFVGDNPTLTLGATPTAGNILVAVAGVWNGVSASNSPWIQVINVAGAVNDGVYAAYRAVTPADTTATISKPAIQASSQGWNITIYELSGAGYAPPVYDFFKEQSTTSKSLNVASLKSGSCLVGCFNTNSGNPAVSSITGATAGTSVAGTSSGGSPRRANPFSSAGLGAGGTTVTVNYGSAPTAITGLGLVFAPA